MKRRKKTLLAKALYDNLADAPDELSFRKGDIVTVIEQDVDDLIGWWLCLLHGKQGIVPGNRLKVIPPYELDAFEKDTKQKSPENTDAEGSGTCNDSNIYDFLPAPVTAGQSNPPPPPLSIKEMFDIPYKRSTQEVYDIAQSENIAIQDELYDIPRTEVIPNELYIVAPSNKSAFVEDCQYDVPCPDNNNNIIQAQHSNINSKGTFNEVENREIYDTPKSMQPLPNYGIPSNTEVNQSLQIYDTPPLSRDIMKGLQNLNLYNTPSHKNVNESCPNEFNALCVFPNDVNMNIIETPVTEIYNVPTKKDSLLGLDEIYNIPNNIRLVDPKSLGYDTPVNNAVAKSDETGYVEPNLPKAESKLDIDKIMAEISDSPFSEEPIISTIKRSPSNSKSTTPRNSMNVTLKSTLDTATVDLMNQSNQLPEQQIRLPRGLSEEIYDVPAKHMSSGNTVDIFNSQETSYNSQVSTQEIYDIPKQYFEQMYDIPTSKCSQTTSTNAQVSTSNKCLPQDLSQGTQFQQIYNTPKSILALSTPIKTNDFVELVGSQVTTQEIYDVPPRVCDTSARMQSPGEIYQIPTSTDIIQTHRQEHCVPTNDNIRAGTIKDLRETFINVVEHEDIYDVPSSHNLKKIMNDVSAAYNLNTQVAQDGNTISTPDDDYMDYHDVWKTEPPPELAQQHSNSASNQDGRPLSDVPRRSILDQINFDLVKELEINTTEALDQLRKLHLAVDTCVQTLLSFWGDNWLEIKILKQTIHSLRDFSGKLKTALRLLTEFGLSTLINCTKVPRGEALMDKLIIEVEPLLESYYKIKICLLHLDSNDWVVPDVRTAECEKFFATLNAIMILSDRIPELCKAFNLGVQTKVHELFVHDPNEDKTITPLLSYQPTPSPRRGPFPSHPFEFDAPCKGEISDTLRRDTVGGRQHGRNSTPSRHVPLIPLIPPKPSLPNSNERTTFSECMEPPESPRFNQINAFGNKVVERLVTEHHPEDNRHKKYASDPATPSCGDQQKTMWGGSCPILMDRHSSIISLPHGGESHSSSSSIGASIPEETIEIKQTSSQRMSKNFPSDSNIGTPPMPASLHTRSASLPWDDRLRNNMTDERPPNSPSLSPLDHRDIESLEFFCRQVESQVVLLRESMKNLTDAVESQDEPVIFVQHAKFISLTGHRVFHCGQDISERLINTDIKAKLKDDTAHLTICIRGVVAATKAAALEYPNANFMMEMISSVLALGDAVRIIYSVCRKALDS